jgi:hypothetical protein
LKQHTSRLSAVRICQATGHRPLENNQQQVETHHDQHQQQQEQRQQQSSQASQDSTQLQQINPFLWPMSYGATSKQLIMNISYRRSPM